MTLDAELAGRIRAHGDFPTRVIDRKLNAHRIAAADDKLLKKEHINLFSLLGPGKTVRQTIINAIIGACNFRELLAILNHFYNQTLKMECRNMALMPKAFNAALKGTEHTARKLNQTQVSNLFSQTQNQLPK